MTERPGDRGLTRAEWGFLMAMITVILYYAVMTEIRSCFLERRMTDFGVYLRAAWAARTGNDMYAVTCDNGWHYCYPPTFALFLMPLADPPSESPREGYLPYPISVGIWVILSYAFAFWAAHRLAKLIVPEAKPGSRRWWSARNGPLFLSAGGIGYTVVHGQVNTLVAALIAAMFVAWVAGRKLASGMWLAGAMAVKVVPAFLVLFPLIHLDRRVLAGIGLGLVLLLGVLPACVFGVSGAIRENRKLVDQVLMPGTTGEGDQTRAKELTQTVATDSHSFQAVIHNYRNPDPYTRPADAAKSTRLIHWAICGLMTAITLLVGWRSRGADVPVQLVLLGCLLLVMVLASPVSHVHHYAMALPAICGLWLKGLADRPGAAWPAPWVLIPLLIWCVGTGLPLFPGPVFVQMREFGIGTSATVILWFAGVCTLAFHRQRTSESRPSPDPVVIANRINLEPGARISHPSDVAAA
ncbi:MAG TPA: glycosyltransferase family 87 protein [Gemmata sp.]|nr:glycosyltransferase family 87 protein [Gemmata sp.]